jgi:CBS domain containing-hemolysin-like protein
MLYVVVVLTLVTSAACSLFEATLYSTRSAALEAARVGSRNARKAERFLEMKRNIAGPTSAILILNTVANTAGAAVAGMLAAEAYGRWAVPVFSIALTVGILFISEVLPKTYGAMKWRILWPLIVWPVTAVEALLRPLVWITQGFARLFVGADVVSHTTQEEILAMIRLGATAGELTPTELEMLTAVFHLDEIEARQLVIACDDVAVFDASWSVDKCLAIARTVRHTRYPLCKGDLSRTVGLVHIKDLLAIESHADVASIARPVVTVIETIPAHRLLRQMQKSRQHLVVVANANGATTGIVTLEDVLAQIVGAIDEFEPDVPDLLVEGGGRYTVPGRISMVEINRRLGLDIEHPSDADTLSAVMVGRIGRLLQAGDIVELDGAVATVLEVVGNQATRIRIAVHDQA